MVNVRFDSGIPVIMNVFEDASISKSLGLNCLAAASYPALQIP